MPELLSRRPCRVREAVKVIIDDVHYIAVGTRRITVDGIVYAEIADPKPRVIIDNDNDHWELRPGCDDTWTCVSYGESVRGDDISREDIERSYGIKSEEF